MRMWQHIEPDILLKSAKEGRLDESESTHLVGCAFCQEVLLFFQNYIATLSTSKPDVKAA